jgi:hypothetical protein
MVRGSKWLLLGVLLLAIAGCGSDGKQAGTQGTTAGGATTTSPTTTTAPPNSVPAGQGSRAYQTWFTRDGQLALAWQEGDQTVGVLTQAMLLLLGGPPSGDAETAIPTGTELVNVGLAGGMATIELSQEFLSGPANERDLAIGQVVFTATQFGTVRAVEILVGGKAASDVLRRRSLADLLPPIVVEIPTGLEPVGSTFTVAGSANVFEANVTIRVLNEDGDELFSDFTTATCGTGCRGRFRSTITVDFDGAESGTLVVQDDDADGDGKPSYEVRIPLEFSG